MKKKRRKKPLIQRLKKQADEALSLYIREKTRQEFGKCPLCGVGEIECCFHFISRRRVALRWREDNVIGACHTCNWVERKFPDLSRAWFIRNRGVEAYLALVDQAARNWRPDNNFLREHLPARIAIYTLKLVVLQRKGNENPPAGSPDRQPDT